MQEKEIHMESGTFHFAVHDNHWELKMPKSQTRVKDARHLSLLTEKADYFIPTQVEEDDDTYTFLYSVKATDKLWSDVVTLNRADKLRLLCNLARVRKILSTRITIFLHPDNLSWDDNLMPSIIHRGIRDLVPPFEVNEAAFFQQYKCLAVAMFSKQFSFNELYSGSIHNARDTDFEKQIADVEDLESLITLLETNYRREKAETEKNMQMVPRRKFRLFKQLSYSMIAVAIILVIPLAYLLFNRLPEQNHLLQANSYFLTNEYGNVISELESFEPDDLPYSAKYILAYSYIRTEKMLGPNQKEVIMKNISMKSDENYLLYWVYNGRGDFESSMNLAMYVDDPTLIIYGLVQQITAAKNDPDLSGPEREEKVQKLDQQLDEYKEKTGLNTENVIGEEEVPSEETSAPANGTEQINSTVPVTEQNPVNTEDTNEETSKKETEKVDKEEEKDPKTKETNKAKE